MIWEDENTCETGDGINRRMFQTAHGHSGGWNTRRRDEQQGDVSGGQNIFQLRSEELGCSCFSVSGSGRGD